MAQRAIADRASVWSLTLQRQSDDIPNPEGSVLAFYFHDETKCWRPFVLGLLDSVSAYYNYVLLRLVAARG